MPMQRVAIGEPHSDTGTNSHVTPDLAAMDTSEAYYGDDALHVGNGKGLHILHIGSSKVYSPQKTSCARRFKKTICLKIVEMRVPKPLKHIEKIELNSNIPGGSVINNMEELLYQRCMGDVRDDIEAYNSRFHERAMLCHGISVPTETKEIEGIFVGFLKESKKISLLQSLATCLMKINMARETGRSKQSG
ncbi:hypothetical protein Tco_1403325 [Tanacetum coccineum]